MLLAVFLVHKHTKKGVFLVYYRETPFALSSYLRIVDTE